MGQVYLTMKLKNGSYLTNKFYVVKNITSYYPKPSINDWVQIKNELAGTNFDKHGKINALLGVGIWIQIIEPEILKYKDEAIAQRTKLGYVIMENRENPYKIVKPYIGAIVKATSIKN